jgi:hypothetical protein
MPDPTVRVEPLAEQLPRGTDAARTAEAVGALWMEIDSALYPVIGHGGVAALFNRSVMLTATANPWLAIEHCDRLSIDALAPLRTALAGQGAAEAEVAGRALFAAFEGLLVSLVGPALTRRLLQPVQRSSP